jgi:hypothetical protein
MWNDTPNVAQTASGYALALPSSAQRAVDKEQDGLVGPVREVRLKTLYRTKIAGLFSVERTIPVRFVSYNPPGNRARVVRYEAGNGVGRHIEVYTYDSTGRKIEVATRRKHISTKTAFQYDQQRLETSEQFSDGKRVIRRSHISVFDEQGNQTEARYLDDSGVETKAFYRYEFDDAGRITTILTYDEGGSLYHRIDCSFESDGRVKAKSAYGPGNQLYERRIFTYERGQSVESRLTYKAGPTLQRKIAYRFDDKKNLIELLAYNAQLALIARTSHDFGYDATGNWLERTSRSWDVATGQVISEWKDRQIISYY